MDMIPDSIHSNCDDPGDQVIQLWISPVRNYVMRNVSYVPLQLIGNSTAGELRRVNFRPIPSPRFKYFGEERLRAMGGLVDGNTILRYDESPGMVKYRV